MRVIAASTRPAKITRRALAKQQTREKVLLAARQLFTERGYEGATIRDIARAAGMSTGAVFASFADKSELFGDILTADHAALTEAMSDAAQGKTTVDSALMAMFKAGYDFHYPQLPLFAAGVAVSWTWTESSEQRNREAVRPIRDLILQQLRAGVERGELVERHDMRLVASTLWDTYVRSYRRAVFDGWSSDDLQTLLRDQVALILAGLRA
ncbi:AcrR family transcriptional regulator [Caulobacter ginsengisoli]|jgi:AcrR family transcriptional regulator|uniref:AcrR family transcriptional regulator n=1 Tax=Caulobacter ginsengisoli TaxID=400775 RepID=A0ABU0IRW3_9CAUL|nr:TetR/AcrR family transcriptional regulator [Caulobacter ginsengisoli]MDQ0464750.1 AcrR family transcriptional regulator [Caulobacter ginsengisoli]